jgi:hypothetical protein
MKTVGTEKPTQKRKSNSKKGIRKEKIEKIKRKEIKNKMNKFETMAIPIEADGIVDNQKAFEKQQKENEAQLRKEIKSAQAEEDELCMGDYEDIELVSSSEIGNQDIKLAKRKRILGHKGFAFARIFS